MRKIFTLLLLTGLPFFIFSQSADLPLNHDLYHFVDRMDIRGYTDTTVHTDLKPYGREHLSTVFSLADTSQMSIKERKWFERYRLLGDDEYAGAQEGKGFLKYFWTNKRDLYAHDEEKFQLYVNPVAYFAGGADLHTYGDTVNRQRLTNFYNGRGLQFRGSAFGKLGFFTEVVETQYKAPQFVRNRYQDRGTLEGSGFLKIYDQQSNLGFDFFQARGYVTYSPVKQMRIKFGKDRAFLGNGYQSLFLSDHSTDHFFLNINTRIWKLEYINHFAQMTDFIPGKPDDFGTHPKKYAVFHQLSYKPTNWLSVGLFESVVYSPTLPRGERGFELEYLNPIIFYRSVEQSLGSPDNGMIGLNWKANFAHHFQSYGQLLIDDFNWRRRNDGKGFWGNKTGVQLGMKYIDVANVSGLDLQVEYNRVRPFTYSHFNPSANYAHYGQHLAHPWGANFHEAVGILRYQVTPTLNLQGTLSYMEKGLDPAGENFGADIFRSYVDYSQEFNNTLGQGDELKVMTAYGRLSYQILKLDAFVDLEGRYRKENEFSSISGWLALRWNIPQRVVRY